MKILIIEAQIKQYRKPFYDGLYNKLREDGIQLRVAYSNPTPLENLKNDNCELPEDYGIKVKGYWIANERILFQPLFREIVKADLVIIDHANKFLINHLLLPLSVFKLKKVAFWGLGENLQAGRSEFSEWYKRLTLNWVDWWFAYTAGTATYLQEQGVPAEKITAVQNSIDTREIQNCARKIDESAKTQFRTRLGIGPSEPVGIFVGMLHKVKSVPFLIYVGKLIREKIANFKLIVVGGGPDEIAIKQLAQQDSWVRFVGPKFGEEKARLLCIADLFLLPGRVGLAVLDGFAAGLPLVATRLPIHGPEMEYLQSGHNGLLTEHDPELYAKAVIDLLLCPQKLEQLREGASLSAQLFSIEAMVENFRNGIKRCLGCKAQKEMQLAWREEQGTP